MAKEREMSVVDKAIQDGLQEIAKMHPELNTEYLSRHFDQSIIEERVSRIGDELAHYQSKKNLSPREAGKLMYRGVKEAILSGEAFDEQGKEFILKKARPQYRARKVRSAGPLENTISAFGDLYSLAKTGDFAARNPQVVKDIAEIEDGKFYDAAVRVLAQYGVLSDKDARVLYKGIEGRIEEGTKKTVHHIARYALPHHFAAGILGIFGAIIVLKSGVSLTGNVVGVGGPFPGAGLIAGSLLMMCAVLMVRRGVGGR